MIFCEMRFLRGKPVTLEAPLFYKIHTLTTFHKTPLTTFNTFDLFFPPGFNVWLRSGKHKMLSKLAMQSFNILWLIARNPNFLQPKVPYFNVSRRFATFPDQ